MNANQSSEEVLTEIKALRSIKFPDYQYLKSLLYDKIFSKIPVLTNKIYAGQSVFRTVSVYRDNLGFGKKSNLSYRPREINYPFFNRCSEPEQRHFYCSTNRHLSMGEVSYFISHSDGPDAVFDINYELLELGSWVATRDIYLADLRYGNYVHPGNESFQAELKARYDAFADANYIRDFFNYINTCFELPVKKSDHLNYWLTACYSNYLFDDDFKPEPGWGTMPELTLKNKMQIDGILYHSVQGVKTTPSMEGYNIALRTALVDKGALKLTKAGIFETRQIGEKEFVFDKLLKINADIREDNWLYHKPTEGKQPS